MLLQVIYVSLKNTLKALEGVIHINQVLEDIYKALTLEQVPMIWLKYSYPSFKQLGTFLSNLKERVSFIRFWLNDKHPFNFWLPGFFD
jgi:dynein heavy chain